MNKSAAPQIISLSTAELEKLLGELRGSLAPATYQLVEVRIRWGQDQQQRAALGLPAWPENSWRHGLDRLLLGYAMAAHGEQLFHDVLPFDDIEGGAADVLGNFAEFLERLFGTLKVLEAPLRLDEWVSTLHEVLKSFFETGEDEESEMQVLRACLEKLARASARSGFDRPVELAVILEQLNRDLSEDRFGAGYLTGGITFCALKPMRSIPAKIICLLGMNDRSFPRPSARLSFDLMEKDPRLGDRSSREDDRYLFLETLLSARERLYISYVGQSIKDNSESPPSVLVSELMDYIEQGFEYPDHDVIAGHILTRHRLQAFSGAYFSGGRLFSYSRENLQASQAVHMARSAPAPFISSPLAEPEPERRQISLQTLADFLRHPARFLATQRLGIHLLSEGGALEEREPFAIDTLDSYLLKEELLERRLACSSVPKPEAVDSSDRTAAGRRCGRYLLRSTGPGRRGVLQTASALQAQEFRSAGFLRPGGRRLPGFRPFQQDYAGRPAFLPAGHHQAQGSLARLGGAPPLERHQPWGKARKDGGAWNNITLEYFSGHRTAAGSGATFATLLEGPFPALEVFPGKLLCLCRSGIESAERKGRQNRETTPGLRGGKVEWQGLRPAGRARRRLFHPLLQRWHRP